VLLDLDVPLPVHQPGPDLEVNRHVDLGGQLQLHAVQPRPRWSSQPTIWYCQRKSNSGA